jgi:hypothetical protein
MSVLSDNNLVVNEEKFDTENGKPKFTVRENKSIVRVKCEMTERATKDNGFLEGTYFIGTVKEREERTYVRGIIWTCPIYHLVVLFLIGLFIYQCFALGGINPVPIILVAFSFIMLSGEFKKQSMIKRYILRALKITYAKNKSEKSRHIADVED